MGFYAELRDARQDNDALQRCIESVVDQLKNAVDPRKPGMLLGKIQSGKTRAFLGVIARAFDRDFDIAIVLTKGTKTLANQTVKRIGRDFKQFIDDDLIVLFDIMQAPEALTKSELRRKIVIVAKKQVHNLARIQALFDEKYPELKYKRVLLVDDEADMASVRFSKKRGEEEYDQGTIATQMDQLRQTLPGIAFLQVWVREMIGARLIIYLSVESRRLLCNYSATWAHGGCVSASRVNCVIVQNRLELKSRQ